MYEMLKHAHSGLRWLVLALLVAAVINAVINWTSKSAYGGKEVKLNKWAMIMVHIQVVIGFALYFLSPKVVFSGAAMKDAVLRFFLVEHLTLMLIAAIIITIGHVRQKKKANDVARNKTVFWFFAIGLVLILMGIPWPFQGYGTGWF